MAKKTRTTWTEFYNRWGMSEDDISNFHEMAEDSECRYPDELAKKIGPADFETCLRHSSDKARFNSESRRAYVNKLARVK